MSLLVQLKFDGKKVIKGIEDDIISLFWKGMWSKIIFRENQPNKYKLWKLRTNLEIYWKKSLKF